MSFCCFFCFLFPAVRSLIYAGHQHQGQQLPADESPTMTEFGATFVPGGFDDYYMPEVLAPAPQR